MKLCQKINCNNFAIHRGKYCEIHRTKKRSNTIQSNTIQNFKEKEEKEFPQQTNNGHRYEAKS